MRPFRYEIVVDGEVIASGNTFETESAARSAMFHQAWLYRAEMVRLLEYRDIIATYDWHDMSKVTS